MAGNGPNYSAKVGRLSMEAPDIARNIETILGNILGNLLCWDEIGFEAVQQINIRIDDCPIELPIYNYLNPVDISLYKNSGKSIPSI